MLTSLEVFQCLRGAEDGLWLFGIHIEVMDMFGCGVFNVSHNGLAMLILSSDALQGLQETWRGDKEKRVVDAG